MDPRPSGGPDSAAGFRWILLGLALLGLAGCVAELATERHWKSLVQDIPWVGVGVTLLAALLVAMRPRARTLWAARVLALVVVGMAAFGIFEHISANHDAGPLDFRYADTWAGMSAFDQWWKAATKSVGPSPVLAPGVLIQAALCVAFATVRHPGLNRQG